MPPKSERSNQQGATWSFLLATVKGTPIRIHFTFFMFLAWIAVAHTGASAVAWVAFIVVIFACVLLHEIGHAMMAIRFGVKTSSITLYPIGGVAMLDSRPEPKAELWIALAGPAVNLVIAAALSPVLLFGGANLNATNALEHPGGFLESILVANLTLAVFNLVPAFPMDGGRVLRAALNLRMSERQATQIAAGVGQALAVALGFVSILSGNVVLFIVAAFVFLGAGQELTATVTRSFLAGHTIADAMQTHFETIPSGASLEVAATKLIEGSQHDFPVTVGEDPIGILVRSDIARGLATDGPTAFVAGHMRREFKSCEPTLPLEKAAELFYATDSSPILVVSEGSLVGMLTQEHLSEFIMIEHARSQDRNHG